MHTVAKQQNVLVGRKQLAKLTGYRDSTLKFYSEQGILQFNQQGRGLARRYDRRQATERLHEIETLRLLGLSIEQIKARFTPNH